ncbi:MAG: triose-phosphate isomerase [Mailhella sp.]|nr:triose-phosphate isomerase [Mailhella sp.]
MKKIIAANWKMNMTGSDAEAFAARLAELLGGNAPEGRAIVVFPPATCLERCAAALKKSLPGAECGAQNCWTAESGAFTGEISPAMILAAGGKWVLSGHSERRHIFGETDAQSAEKCAFALSKGLKSMLCIGETLEERESGRLEEVLARQLEAALGAAASLAGPESFAVAYEPVWAIGTGKSACSEDIAEAHAFVRSVLAQALPFGGETPILYGGSAKPANAAEILNLDNVCGLLIGSASLQADSFAKIATA